MNQAEKAERRRIQRLAAHPPAKETASKAPARREREPEEPEAPEATPLPDPRFAAGRAALPSPEEWAQWCENPVTRFVASGMMAAALANRESALHSLWNGSDRPTEGETLTDAALRSQAETHAARVRADAYMAFVETPRSRYVQFLAS